ASIITKVTKIASTLSEQSHSQRRLIFRLVKSIGVSDEAMVYDLVPEADWDLKRQIMSTKLFLKDAIYVPIKHLARGLQDLETTLRAELIIVCSQELRALLTASVGARTKKYEVLQLEVDQIQRNGRRLENIRLREFEILEAFMVSLRNAINGDQAIIDQIILAQAQALGIDPPAGLKIKDKSAA
ncbi:MAG: hypothetical protein NTV34_01960, partial [Proteobacteria bacterium]|nr:hypothetical protein [Pseudomonadota bacterium]